MWRSFIITLIDVQEAAVTTKVLWDTPRLLAHCAMGPDTPPESGPALQSGGGEGEGNWAGGFLRE